MNFEQQLQHGMNHLSAHDTVMAQLIRDHGMPTFRPHKNYYQELCESIVSQQLSIKAAATILQRFIALYGHFPSPAEIVTTHTDTLRSAGLSRPKVSYINDIAQQVTNGTINFESIDKLDNDQIIHQLTQIKGIGVWTAHMFLLFAVGRLDILVTGDLGVRNALTLLYAKEYNFDHVVKSEEIELLAKEKNWHPYESLVCWYAWQSLKNTPVLAA